jgi:hypothetical protein
MSKFHTNIKIKSENKKKIHDFHVFFSKALRFFETVQH